MSGIAFKIGDEFLKLPENQKISISLENQLFTNNVIAGAISLPFSVDNTAHNRKLLNLSNTLQSFGDTEIVTGVACFLGGNLWRKGKMIINSQTPNSINLSFVEFDKEEDFDNITLQDLNLPVYDTSQVILDRHYFGADGYPIPTNASEFSVFYRSLLDRLNINLTSKDFVCPIVYNDRILDVTNNITNAQNCFFNGHFAYVSVVPTWSPTFINQVTINENDHPFLDDSLGPSKGAMKYNMISPFCYLNYILERVANTLGLAIENIFFNSHSELQNLIIYTNRALLIDDPSSYIIFRENELNLSKYLPKINFTNFLKSLKNTFNLIYYFDWQNQKLRILSKENQLQNFKNINISNISSPYEQVQYKSDGIKIITAITYAKQDDAIISDAEFFSIKTYQYRGWLSDSANLPNIGNNKNDLFICQNFGAITYDKSSYNIFIWNGTIWEIAENVNPAFYLKRPFDIYFSKEDKEKDNILKLEIDTTIERIDNQGWDNYTNINIINSIGRYANPAVDIYIATDSAMDGANRVKTDTDVIENLHLLFYRGMAKELKHGFDFPYAGRTNFFPARILSPTLRYEYADSFQWSLDIDGPKGLYEKCYKNWTDFTKQVMRIVTYTVRWKASDITDDLFYNYLQIDSKKFILQKLTINATPTQILPCKAEMYQLEPK